MKKCKTKIGLVIVFLSTFVLVPPVFAQQDAEQLFQSGVYKANVEGDLESAIEIFERIIRDFPENRSVAAQALLYLGSSFEKLGSQKAENTYQRLIEEYADQLIAVSEARIRLQKMRYDELANGIQSEDSVPDYQLALDADVPSAHPLREKQFDLSPDGKRIVYQGKDGLYVSDITGTLRQRIVAHNPDRTTWQVIWVHVGGPRWSPDGTWIAYKTGRRPSSNSDEYIYTLAIVSPDGKQNRVLAPELDPQPGRGLCWLPDGSGLTYLSSAGFQTINLDGKLIKTVKGKFHGLSKIFEYSPDGRWLLLHQKPKLLTDSYEIDVSVIPASGGDTIWITHSDGFDGQPNWSADGRTIYFISERSQNLNVWKVSFDSQSGKVGDDFKQVTFFTDARIMFPNVIGVQNKILFSLDKKTNTVHVADVADPETYVTLARGVKPALSPDGKTLYYVGEGSSDEDQGIFAIVTDDGTPQRLTKVRPAAGAKDLSPDGRTLAYFSDVEGGQGLYALSVDGGEPRLLMKNECGDCCADPRWSPDGETLAYTYKDGLYTISASGGDSKKLSTLYLWESWTVRWSPDGKYIAALAYQEGEKENAVYVVPAEGGEAKLLSGDNKDYKEGLEWTPDGQSLVYHLSRKNSKILKTYLDGRPPELFLEKPDGWYYFGVWAPDGKSYYFRNWVDEAWYLSIYDSESGKFSRFSKNARLPNWSADGKTIAWSTERAIRQLWVMEDTQ